MKFFSIIFVFSLLFSAWQPCRNLTAEDAFCTVSAEKFAADDLGSDEPEDCSEFGGCSGEESADAEVNSTISLGGKFFILTEKPTENIYRNYRSQTYPASIWQPPKNIFTA